MASNADLMAIARNEKFQDRVRYDIQKAAVSVMAEDSSTASHPQRITYARLILDGNVQILSFCIAVVTNSTISTEATLDPQVADFGIPDSDIEFTVNSLFNSFAGVSK
jgi:hypothetical protein